MSLLLILGVLIVPLLFGYFFWRSAMDNYNYNVFNLGVLVRLFIGVLVCFFDLNTGIVVLSILTIWNFIAVLRNTSLFTAILFLIFQPAAIYFCFWILTRKWD